LSNSSESVIALFDSVAVAETAARRIEAWTGSSSHGRLESLGVLVKADNGAISLRKLGPRETRNGAAVGLVAGALSACATEGLSMVRGLVAGAAGGGAVGWLFRKNLRLSATTRSRIGVRLRPGRCGTRQRSPRSLWSTAGYRATAALRASRSPRSPPSPRLHAAERLT